MGISKQQAERSAAAATVQTGRVHTVQTRQGFFGAKHSVQNTLKIANPVQRREALRKR